VALVSADVSTEHGRVVASTGATHALVLRAVSAALDEIHATTSGALDLVDVTDAVSEAVARRGVWSGAVHLFCMHTTCSLTVDENEKGMHDDLGRVLDELAPRESYWAHDDLSIRWQNLARNERANGHSHVRAALAGHPSLLIPVAEGALHLGVWQRVFLVDFDGGRERRLAVQMWQGVPEVAGTERIP
jgi:secondary thiamine-phosphate synthase enzyme